MHRITVYVPELNLQFDHFLVRDEEPLLFHIGLKGMFPEVGEAVGKLIVPARLRWISFSYFESDECGPLNHWLEVTPQAEPVCSVVGPMVSVNDFPIRPARTYGRRDLHDWPLPLSLLLAGALAARLGRGSILRGDAKNMLCSGLFHHVGDVGPLTESNVVARSREAMREYQQGPLANYVPCTPHAAPILKKPAELGRKTLAIMHGSSFVGDGGLPCASWPSLSRRSSESPNPRLAEKDTAGRGWRGVPNRLRPALVSRLAHGGCGPCPEAAVI